MFETLQEQYEREVGWQEAMAHPLPYEFTEVANKIGRNTPSGDVIDPLSLVRYLKSLEDRIKELEDSK